ncbi:MAG: sulfur oxidation c-type cytochrome SoxX [Burkholderiales bacterium]|nr:sulfur oxidation c-type cytochrome SoxX [Burkholderiales bacterium]
MKPITLALGAATGAVLVLSLAGCVATPPAATDAKPAAAPAATTVDAVMRESFKETGIAKLDRLNQSDLQRACSAASATGKTVDGKTAVALQNAARAAIKYPADGKYLGDWKRGEAIAQNGRGLQFTDTATTVNGGNCYACHQIDKAELAYGNIGPSLTAYGKKKGNSEAALKAAWGRIWNSHSVTACNAMPRFGDAGILTEAQIKDVMALLFDPASPVNK